MTYCVGIAMSAGLVFVSDSRTNAGVDQVSTYSKMHVFETAPDRAIVVLAAGNLATTQGIVERLENDLAVAAPKNLNTAVRFSELADYVGEVSVAEQQKVGGGPDFEVSLIVGGQIGAEKPQIMLVYPQGNHITTSEDTPFLQIGESKYGKPILDRIIGTDTPLETAVLCALVSMDSTMRSNLTVGPPIEAMLYQTDTLTLPPRLRFTENSEYLRKLRSAWDAKLKEAFHQLPPLAWASNWDSPGQLVQPPLQPLQSVPGDGNAQQTIEQAPGLQQTQNLPPIVS